MLGKSPGATNLVMWHANGKTSTVLRAQVTLNLAPLRELLQQILPAEKEIEVLASGDAVILKGTVSDVVAADMAQRVALTQLESDASPVARDDKANADNKPTRSGPRVVNLLKIRSPQQVMLEVRVAEVSKSYLESLGIEWGQTGGLNNGSLMTGFVSTATLDLTLGRGSSQRVNPDGTPQYNNRDTNVKIQAERKDGWVKILAEPTIVAMSGQEGSFLVGGKIFIPVNQALGSTTYEERTYGCLLYTSPSPRDYAASRMPSSA